MAGGTGSLASVMVAFPASRAGRRPRGSVDRSRTSFDSGRTARGARTTSVPKTSRYVCPTRGRRPAQKCGQCTDHHRAQQYYIDSWNQYAEYAFGKDSFNPVAKTGGYGGGGWGLIIVDGIDTAVVMGLKDIVDRQLKFIAEQDFTTSMDPRIDGFDTIIRVIGGLLSAYDLITSGKVPHANSYHRKHVQALLQAAADTADLISPLFEKSPTGLPYFWLDIADKNAYGGINTAVAGTIIIEYHRLSDLTGDEKYRKQADKANSYLLNPEPKPKYPSLVGSVVDVETGKFTTGDAGWFSGIDSFYEVRLDSPGALQKQSPTSKGRNMHQLTCPPLPVPDQVRHLQPKVQAGQDIRRLLGHGCGFHHQAPRRPPVR